MVCPITYGDHKETTGQKYNGPPITQGGHNEETMPVTRAQAQCTDRLKNTRCRDKNLITDVDMAIYDYTVMSLYVL